MVLSFAKLRIRPLQLWFLRCFKPHWEPQSKCLSLPQAILNSLLWWTPLPNLVDPSCLSQALCISPTTTVEPSSSTACEGSGSLYTDCPLLASTNLVSSFAQSQLGNISTPLYNPRLCDSDWGSHSKFGNLMVDSLAPGILVSGLSQEALTILVNTGKPSTKRSYAGKYILLTGSHHIT